MTATWRPTPHELDRYASRHIEYEVRMMLHQIRYLEELFPDGPVNAIGDALIEAPIVHLRLFDDFFRAKAIPTNDDVVALHWDRSWAAREILTHRERDEVNQHAHLVARRGTAAAWQPRLPTLALRFCAVFQAFVSGLEPDRAEAFTASTVHVEGFQKWMADRS